MDDQVQETKCTPRFRDFPVRENQVSQYDLRLAWQRDQSLPSHRGALRTCLVLEIERAIKACLYRAW